MMIRRRTRSFAFMVCGLLYLPGAMRAEGNLSSLVSPDLAADPFFQKGLRGGEARLAPRNAPVISMRAGSA